MALWLWLGVVVVLRLGNAGVLWLGVAIAGVGVAPAGVGETAAGVGVLWAPVVVVWKPAAAGAALRAKAIATIAMAAAHKAIPPGLEFLRILPA